MKVEVCANEIVKCMVVEAYQSGSVLEVLVL